MTSLRKLSVAVSSSSRWRGVWESLTAPPRQKPVYLFIYVATVYMGLVSLRVPPESIQAEMGPALTVTWSCLLLLGGAVGACTVLTRLWWLERLGLACAALGLTMYSTVVLYLHFSSEGSRLSQFGVLLVAGCAYALRWLAIRHWDYCPRDREA